MKMAYSSAFLCIIHVIAASYAYKLNKFAWYSSPGGALAPTLLRPCPGYAYAYNARKTFFSLECRWFASINLQVVKNIYLRKLVSSRLPTVYLLRS